MVAVKRIFRYLKGTEDHGLWYPYRSDFSMNFFIDVDWAGNLDGQKSTTSGAFFLGARLVSWISRKQSCTSQSTNEVEYVATYMNCTQAIRMRHVLDGFKVNVTELVAIYYDNTGAINIEKNPKLHARTKHIELKYHFLRERVKNKEVRMAHVTTKE